MRRFFNGPHLETYREKLVALRIRLNWLVHLQIPSRLDRRSYSRDQLLLKLGAAQQQSPSAWRLVQVDIPEGDGSLKFSLRKDRLRRVRRREGRYLLRTNLVGRDPAQMWEFYTQLIQVEEAFKNLKGDLAIRPP